MNHISERAGREQVAFGDLDESLVEVQREVRPRNLSRMDQDDEPTA